MAARRTTPPAGQSTFDTFKPTVPDGTALSQATTNMIKALRRGREIEALYWFQQLEQGGFWKYGWRRLLIFASEDVNIGDPNAVVQVRALYDNYVTVKTESKNPVVDRSIATMAVMVLARAEKSREVDDLLNVIEHLRGQYGWTAPQRDEMFDLHTEEGKRRWPRWARLRQWLEAASHETNRVGPRDWHLWLLKWAAQRGLYDVDWVKRTAILWNEKGWLLYGVEGDPVTQIPWEDVEPEFPGLTPGMPKLTEDGWLSDAPWVWSCRTCGTPLDQCAQHEMFRTGAPSARRKCCSECSHDPADMSVTPGTK